MVFAVREENEAFFLPFVIEARRRTLSQASPLGRRTLSLYNFFYLSVVGKDKKHYKDYICKKKVPLKKI